MDVVVTDHHTPRADGALPDAPIVHPRLGGYPCPDLCAAGVAYKLAQRAAGGRGEDRRPPTRTSTCVALATVADVVSLRGENRRLVRAGLRELAGTRKPGLRALMDVARVDPSGVDEARSASGSGRGSTPPAASTAPTPASSCCSPPTPSGRARSPPSSTRSTPSAATSRPASASRPRRWWPSRRAGRRRVRAGGRGLAPGRDRHRRRAHRRAPPPAGRADRAGRATRARARAARSPASTCSPAWRPAPTSCCATAATAPPPG